MQHATSLGWKVSCFAREEADVFWVFQSCDMTFQHRSCTRMLRAAVNRTHTPLSLIHRHLTDYMQTQFCSKSQLQNASSLH